MLLIAGAWGAPAPDKGYLPPAAPACPLQRVEQSTGYGCQEGEECNTIYDEQCR